MTDRAVDGIVVIEARVLDTPNLQLPQEVPAVIADSSASHDHPTFGMDEAAGARAAVGHLLELGHRTVHHRSEEHTSELQSRGHLVCRLLREKKKYTRTPYT